jgi:hypothetical protein
VGSILPPHLSIGNFCFLTWGTPYHHIYENYSATVLLASTNFQKKTLLHVQNLACSPRKIPVFRTPREAQITVT